MLIIAIGILWAAKSRLSIRIFLVLHSLETALISQAPASIPSAYRARFLLENRARYALGMPGKARPEPEELAKQG